MRKTAWLFWLGFLGVFPAQAGESAGITLPPGFHAQIFADNLGRVRHIAVRDDGVVYAALRQKTEEGGIRALRDRDGDGKADDIVAFGDVEGTGLAIAGAYLYFGADDKVLRFRFAGDALIPSGAAEVIVAGFPEQRQHAAKSLALDGQGGLYVNVGAPSNACQEQMRTRGSPGLKPCPQLVRQAGIWRFDAQKPGQTQADGKRYVSGIRNAVALDWNRDVGALYFVQHGRDQLSSLWPDYFDDADNAEKPAEEFHRAVPGGDYGWPYSYYDPVIKARMAAPEYGGDGKTRAAPGAAPEPLIAFPAHWAPNDLLFYEGTQFPAGWRGGAFIAFHGSWNRAPLPQAGYNVVFVPMKDGVASGPWQVFADGFKGADPLTSSGEAAYRPMGLGQAPDGALYIADSVKGRIWRVTYEGK
ncbi:MAG: PQQ-dependent sugar dehydrogenase [Pseudomonadota bacterium]